MVEKGGIKVEEELKYTLQKIEQNFSNYSAWHHRMVYSCKRYEEDYSNFLLEELEYVHSAFYTSPDDQSTWFYFRWLVSKAPLSLLLQELSLIQQLTQIEPKAKWPILTLIFLHKKIQQLKEKEKGKEGEVERGEEEGEGEIERGVREGEGVESVSSLVEKLINLDPFHKNYYTSLLQNLSSLSF